MVSAVSDKVIKPLKPEQSQSQSQSTTNNQTIGSYISVHNLYGFQHSKIV